MASPFLSVIVPAHNEENRLPQSLEQIFTFLQAQPYTAEVLVVENGSTDGTLEGARTFTARHPQLRVLSTDQSGKGLAVQRGMLEAAGEYRFMCDADLSMPIAELNCFIPPALSDFDLAIGSREAPGAVRYNEPAYRHLGGRLINLVIRLFALPGLQDSQCGFKCFTARAAEDLFRCQMMKGWSFDIELLYIARKRGYHIVEVPIPWYFNPQSKLRVVKDATQMFIDIVKIRMNARRGLYGRAD